MAVSAQSERVQAVERLIAMATGADICPRCKGEGELYRNVSFPVDPQMDDYAECPVCHGTGERPPR